MTPNHITNITSPKDLPDHFKPYVSGDVLPTTYSDLTYSDKPSKTIALTQIEFFKRFEERFHEAQGYPLVSKFDLSWSRYNGASEPLLIYCKEHHCHFITAQTPFLRNGNCPICAANVKKRYERNLQLLTEYVKSKSDLTVKDWCLQNEFEPFENESYKSATFVERVLNCLGLTEKTVITYRDVLKAFYAQVPEVKLVYRLGLNLDKKAAMSMMVGLVFGDFYKSCTLREAIEEQGVEICDAA